MIVGFKNLRALEDTGDIHIKPLTVLLGTNSSGKSTFLRTFPLLKQSIETRTTGPILWYGRFVDFGDFSNALNDRNKDDFIEFIYHVDFSNSERYYARRYYRRRFLKFQPNKSCRIAMQVRGDKENRTYASHLEIKISDFNIQIDIAKSGQINEVKIDDYVLSLNDLYAINLGNSFLPQILSKNPVEKHYSINSYRFFEQELSNMVNEIAGRNLAERTVAEIVDQFNPMSNADLFESLKRTNIKTFKNKVENWSIDSQKYRKLKSIILMSLLPHYLEWADHYIADLAKNTSYIAPLRATAERYYRPQDLSVDEVDFQGKNLALVLRNFSLREKNEFEKWCFQFFKFFPKAKTLGGNITVNVKFEYDDSEHNIADLGFGFSQILPIITQIWIGSRHSRNVSSTQRYRDEGFIKIYAIEQPELHLHPKIQAKLIDAIVQVIKYYQEHPADKIYFILETHSETIVNSIGKRVYKGLINADSVNVLMFEKNIENSSSKVTQTSFNDEGILKDWPFGFFEEDNL